MKFIIAICLIACTVTGLAQELKNPSFEEDIGAIGLPDHWIIPKGVSGSLVTAPKTDGAKAVRFTDGLNVLAQNLDIKSLAGSKLLLSFDAASPDGARVSVTGGWFLQKPDGKKSWHAPRLLPPRVLTPQYTTVSLTREIHENAVDGRLYLAFQRIGPGTLYLDNVRLRVLPPGTDFSEDDQKALTTLRRDFAYAQSKVAKLGETGKSLAPLMEAHAAALDLVRDAKSLARVGSLDRINAQINRLSCADSPPAGWCDPFERLDLAGLTRNPIKTMELPVLGNEWQALGVEIANPEDKAQTVDITVKGLDRAAERIELRRQVPLMNFYQREQSLTPDALTLLPKDGSTWKLTLEPGERVRLYLSFKVKANGVFDVTLNAGGNELSARLISRGTLPNEEFGNFQFMYTHIQPAGSFPELTAKDLAEHYTTGVEYTGPPSVVCKPDGTIVSCNMNGHRRNLKAYSEQGIEPILFWFPALKFKIEGTDKFIERYTAEGALTPEFEKAYVELFRRWAEFVEKEGFPQQISILPFDEPSSGKDFANPPGPKVRLARRAFELAREASPKYKRYLTATYYTLPEDYDLLVPETDIILPHWPSGEKLARFSPPGYNPRTAYFEKIFPMLKQRQNMKIWSYHVDKGKAQEVEFELYYPLAVASIGMNGVGTWAYNVYGKSSWDETDGTLDYSFIYYGKEGHPLCRKYNPTGEILIPSIRWEALRMGIQNARILSALMKKNPPEFAPVLKRLQDLATGPQDSPKPNHAELNDISRKLREIITR